MTKELTAKDIKKLSADELYCPAPDASHMLVACRRDDYSASCMARAVEDADAHVLNLNVTALHPEGAGPDNLCCFHCVSLFHNKCSCRRELEHSSSLTPYTQYRI